MFLTRTTAMTCVLAAAMQTGAAMAQYVKTPPGPPGGLPGAAFPAPTMPSAPAPSLSLPPAAPDLRAPSVVVPPPPPAVPAPGARDAGGPEQCDCYRTVDGRRVLTGRSAACCPR